MGNATQSDANGSGLGRLRIPASVAAEILRHAREQHPLECCGALLAASVSDTLIVARAHPLLNDDAAAATRYAISARALVSLERAADREGMAVIGFYHSHPSGEAVPSATDRAAAVPWYVYVIAGLGVNPPELRAYSFSKSGVTELSIES